MLGMLQVIAGPDQGKTFFFGKRATTIGRTPTNGIILTDAQVSRVHCEIHWDGQRVLVTDHGSIGGTWVNSERLTTPRELQPGDVLAVGESHLEFRWSQEDEKATTAWQPPGQRS